MKDKENIHLLKKWSDSNFAFGGAALSGGGGGYGFGPLEGKGDEKELLQFVFERGIRIFDTAPIYGFGQSERVLGNFFKKKREEIYFISKSGVHWSGNKRIDMTNDPKVTRKMLEDSLRRLETEYIDLYMIHWPDKKIDIRYPLEELSKAKNEGKIHHIGLSNTTSEDFHKACEIDKIEVIQGEHNIFKGLDEKLREDIERENLAFMGWGTFDKGIITGRVNKRREQSKDYHESDCRRKAPWWKQRDVLRKCEAIEKVKEIADEYSLSMIELALRYLFSHSWHGLALIGAKTKEDWESILEVELLPLKEELRKKVEVLCRE